MYVFADETSSRYLTCTLPLDYDTVAVADKFGNFGVLRLPGDISQQVRDTLGTLAPHIRARWLIWHISHPRSAPSLDYIPHAKHHIAC